MLREEHASMRGREEALAEINKISFTIDELRLYLDTHPRCTEALVMIKEYMKKRHELMADFTRRYGSIVGYMINDEDETWLWNSGFMPWENGEGGFC